MASSKTSPARSASIDVSGPSARALGAAWRGTYHFVGGRVENWEIVPPTEDNPTGELIAHGFSVNGGLDPNQIISDITGKDRRLEFFPFYFNVTNPDYVPMDYTNPQDMTNFLVQYLKGSVDEGTAKTPEYWRTGVANYKSGLGIRTRRGPKRKVIRLDELENLDPSQLAEIEPDALDKFLEMAHAIQSRNQAAATANGNGQPNGSKSDTTEEVAAAS